MNRNRKKYLEHHHGQVSGFLVIEIVSEKLKPSYYLLRNFLRVGFIIIIVFIAYIIYSEAHGPEVTTPVIPQQPGKGWIAAPITLLLLFVLYFGPIMLKEKDAFINIIGNVQASNHKFIITIKNEKTELNIEDINEIYFDYSGFLGEVSVGEVVMRSPDPTYSGVENYLTVKTAVEEIKVKLFLNTEYQAVRLKEIIRDLNKAGTNAKHVN